MALIKFLVEFNFLAHHQRHGENKLIGKVFIFRPDVNAHDGIGFLRIGPDSIPNIKKVVNPSFQAFHRTRRALTSDSRVRGTLQE